MHREVPERRTLASLLDDYRVHGRETALVTHRGLRRESCSYSDLAMLAGRFAAELERREIHKGDRVLLWGENSPEWVADFFGCVLRGVLAVPLDAAGSVGFAQRVVEDVQPKLIAGGVVQLRMLGGDRPSVMLEQARETLYANPDYAAADLRESDPVQIVFTSGTTGTPKGIVHTHGNVLASLRPIEREMQKYLRYERLVHPLRILHTLPLSHVFGQFMGLWIPPLLAAEIHLESRLLAAELARTIRDERISALAAVPRVLDLLRDHLTQRFPSLEARRQKAGSISVWKRWWLFRDVHRALGWKFWAMICGGAALPMETEAFWNSLGYAVIQGYGMTETTALVSLNHPFRTARGTLGEVLPGREVKLGGDGEVLVRGDTVATSTWSDGALRANDSEWIATGDLAELDATGHLKFRGRKKDVIVTSAGLNVYPEDLEAALRAQPEIRECAVVEFAGPHGPEPMAALVLHGGAAAAAVERANQTLATYQRLARWMVWPEPDLPRTSTGKVLRRDVARVLAHTGADAPVGGSLTALLERVSARVPAAAGDDAQASGDLQLDSLARVELQAGLEERFQMVVDDAAMQNVRTVEDLRALVSSSAAGRRDTAEAPPESRATYAYPLWPWWPEFRGLRVVFLEAVARPLTMLLAKPMVRRSVDEAPAQPVLLFANHVTTYDVPLILLALPGPLRRNLAIAMSGEMLLDWRKARGQGNLVLNLLAPAQYLLVTALFNVFPLPRAAGFRQSFAHAAHAMDRGYSVLVFPEGHRSEDEHMARFKSGAGLLWNELRAPALPVYLGGLGELKRTGSGWFRSRRITVEAGSLLFPRPGLSAEDATAAMERALHELAGSGRVSS